VPSTWCGADDKGDQLEDLPPLKEGGLNRRQIDKKKIIIFPEGQLDLYIPMAEIVVVPPPCIENAMYLMTNIHFSGVDAYTARENKRKEESMKRTKSQKWKDAEPGPRCAFVSEWCGGAHLSVSGVAVRICQ